jgi:hypothetical protein
MTSPTRDLTSRAWSLRRSENSFDRVRLVAASEIAVRHALRFLALAALSWNFVERPFSSAAARVPASRCGRAVKRPYTCLDAGGGSIHPHEMG